MCFQTEELNPQGYPLPDPTWSCKILNLVQQAEIYKQLTWKAYEGKTMYVTSLVSTIFSLKYSDLLGL